MPSDVRTQEGLSTEDRSDRLRRLTDIFAPHVKDVVAEEARRRTLHVAISTLSDLALSWRAPTVLEEAIIERALMGEAQMIVREWTLLLQEYAADAGRELRVADLDEAMLPPLPEDLGRILRECCGRRMADLAMTREVLRRVRASLPAGEPIPLDAARFLEARGIAVAG